LIFFSNDNVNEKLFDKTIFLPNWSFFTSRVVKNIFYQIGHFLPPFFTAENKKKAMMV